MCTQGTLIANNTFTNSLAVQGDAPFPGAVTGLTVHDNVINTTAGAGIEFRGIVNSTISNNIVRGSGIGIFVRQSLGCLNPIYPGWDCFYSTGNLVTGNVALGNGTDLMHDPQSTPNVWRNNTCQTKSGSNIPNCTGSTLAVQPLRFAGYLSGTDNAKLLKPHQKTQTMPFK